MTVAVAAAKSEYRIDGDRKLVRNAIGAMDGPIVSERILFLRA